MRKIIIMGGSVLLCLAVGTYAMIISSDAQHYQIDSDAQGGVCLTGTDGQRYVTNYYNQNQRDLFVPKKTIAEWNSFLQAATGTNSIGLSDTYFYNGEQNICGSMSNCTHGTKHDYNYYDVSPNCYEERSCTTPCGEVNCNNPIPCHQ